MKAVTQSDHVFGRKLISLTELYMYGYNNVYSVRCCQCMCVIINVPAKGSLLPDQRNKNIFRVNHS